MRYRPGYRCTVKEVTADAAALYESGLTLREVGERLGVSHETIRKWLKRQNVNLRIGGVPVGHRPSDETRRRMSVAGKRRAARPSERERIVPSIRGLKVTRQVYDAVMASRPAVCECCGSPQTGRKKVLSIDHCHSTGELRGWLCHRCNTGIGMLGDDASGLRRALAYLERQSPL